MAPALRPVSVTMCCIVVRWKPSLEKQAMAASMIRRRCDSRYCSSTRGTSGSSCLDDVVVGGRLGARPGPVVAGGGLGDLNVPDEVEAARREVGRHLGRVEAERERLADGLHRLHR